MATSANAEQKRKGSRRDRTRQALLAAGEGLISGSGDALSIDDVVARAQVAKGTFYNHFADKAEFLKALIDEARDELARMIIRETEGVEDPARKIVRGFCIALRYRVQHPDRSRFLAMSYGPVMTPGEPRNLGIISFVADGMNRGRFRLATLESGVLLTWGLIQICSNLGLEEDSGFATISRIQQLGAILLRGFGLSCEEADMLAAQETDLIVRPLYSGDASQLP